jgi:outer membrane immunogenic protein
MKKLLLASLALAALGSAQPALAADMPVKARPLPPAVIPFSWTGFYIGGQVGWARATDEASIENPGVPVAIFLPFEVEMEGVIGGGHVGFLWQYNNIVLGLEGSIDASDLDSSFQVGICPLFCGAATTSIDVQASLRGRLGFAFDRFLVYATGGIAFADITNTYNTTPFGGGFASIGDWRTGWTAGGGLEYAFTNNWSARGEYRYSDFGDVIDKSNVAFFPATNLNRHVTQHQAQLGVSYRFGR